MKFPVGGSIRGTTYTVYLPVASALKMVSGSRKTSNRQSCPLRGTVTNELVSRRSFLDEQAY